MFNRRRKDKKVYEDIRNRLSALNEHVIIRSMIYDSQVPNPELVARRLGLSPMSEELCEHERLQSMHRCSKFLGVVDLIDMHASLLSQVMSASYISSLDEEELSQMSDKALIALEVTFSTISRASILSWLTIMDSIGLIRRGGNFNE